MRGVVTVWVVGAQRRGGRDIGSFKLRIRLYLAVNKAVLLRSSHQNAWPDIYLHLYQSWGLSEHWSTLGYPCDRIYCIRRSDWAPEGGDTGDRGCVAVGPVTMGGARGDGRGGVA